LGLWRVLRVATGEVTGACFPKHRHQEFLAFLNALVRGYPRKPLHVVLDNSSTHSTPEVTRWLERHKRVQFHFTPTSASWMNMIEIWFSILTKQQVRRGVYHDVPELIAAIEHFIDGHNERAQVTVPGFVGPDFPFPPQPFVWTKTAEQILTKATKLRRARARPGQGVQHRRTPRSTAQARRRSGLRDRGLRRSRAGPHGPVARDRRDRTDHRRQRAIPYRRDAQPPDVQWTRAQRRVDFWETITRDSCLHPRDGVVKILDWKVEFDGQLTIRLGPGWLGGQSGWSRVRTTQLKISMPAAFTRS
jgi:transposase